MKNYFRNLLAAVLGQNPCQKELDMIASALSKAREEFDGLKNMYAIELQARQKAERRLIAVNSRLFAIEKSKSEKKNKSKKNGLGKRN